MLTPKKAAKRWPSWTASARLSSDSWLGSMSSTTPCSEPATGGAPLLRGAKAAVISPRKVACAPSSRPQKALTSSSGIVASSTCGVAVLRGDRHLDVVRRGAARAKHVTAEGEPSDSAFGEAGARDFQLVSPTDLAGRQLRQLQQPGAASWETSTRARGPSERRAMPSLWLVYRLALGMGENLGGVAGACFSSVAARSRPMDQHDLLIKIRETHTELSWLQPFRDLGLIPNPAASEVALKRAEKRLEHKLPPSYRAFLALHDGWPRFFDGASLLGTATLGHRKYEDLARAAFEAAETPLPELGPPTSPARAQLDSVRRRPRRHDAVRIQPGRRASRRRVRSHRLGERAGHASAELLRVPGVDSRAGRARPAPT